ncbi:transmembrane protease serine 11B-like protein [Belonocnema kinseyi]|uniref:transmembrane protease serine 11B-like protein n=1 Tax=Belonocnema kinseyi TaxID=2817044 RepID=UPI00143D12BD|nr:transmembrane protease serine 11B-like protein [Belonocnema kinseyi]
MLFRSFCYIFILALSRDEVTKSNALTPRIINGQYAQLGEFPYQVSLQYNNQRHCGGSILNPKYVLTAAHCLNKTLREFPYKIRILAGTVKLSQPQSIHYVEKIILHPHYIKSTSQNDIALIKVKIPFVFSKFINFISLPQSNTILPIYQLVTVCGWGLSYSSSSGYYKPDHLQKANLVVLDEKVCKQLYSNGNFGKYMDDTQFCLHYPNAWIGTCSGDSGGAVTVNGVLVGVNSWGSATFSNCGRPGFPDVCTKVSKYLDWITANII